MMECYHHNVQGLLVGTCLVLVLYQDKLQLCLKGKEKFTLLQLAWMETMRDVIHLIKVAKKESSSSFIADCSTSLNMT